ncbi:type II toxin-antitoxin system RelE/ParE family toxin [Ornithinimicrobium ciconiae]|uniref:Type II toxin-antitoxin system RelE/ParE family toxin n=1 Tax=Ornithinimicrobium ciconiae TaxID=2594265 RepID=A0A516GCF4_9MICO|nr:type II toxin-antitoxin system RelE/ParE family toxin [Ornithinimicrobium ciconiae]QDO89201.1 type II toxin-antitoxin system RelE/ParE family toxin [Ornithinimicrobium ciconiae]
MSYQVGYTPKALKEIGRLDRAQVKRIRRFFEETLDLENPRSRGKPLNGPAEWRYRIGDYRLLCLIEDHVLIVLVVRVAHRREVYR